MDRPASTGLPFDLADATAYRRWRDAKLDAFPRSVEELRVVVDHLAEPSDKERAAILAAVARCNMAHYVSKADAGAESAVRRSLAAFLASFGLTSVEDHRSAGELGFVAIEVSSRPEKRGFIPYTTRPLNWHTDGYYNPPDAPIRAMLLHCVRSASTGGENALLDPEIAYIRLRDTNPAWIAALMHPEAMTIPAMIEEDGRQRPASTGPVFMVSPQDGRLVMRYTARTRNIEWRKTPDTQEAVAFLNTLLMSEDDPFIFKLRLAPGEGLLCNNVLHTRTAFEDRPGLGRLVLRARFATPVGHAL